MRFTSPWFAACGLVIFAFALRAWRLPELTVFQGDQGLDALAARHLVLDGLWPLEGPATSAGGVHLGPLYYYLLALPMWFGAFDPLAEALLMVVLNTLAIVVLYWLLALWFEPRVALAGAALYCASPAAIVAARSAWNPAPAPLFLLLALLGLAQSHRQRDGRWLVLVGFGLGCLIQFHYFTAGIVGVCLAFAAYETVRSHLYPWAVVAALTFIALLLPFVTHEIATGLPNLQAAATLAGSSQTPQDSLPRRLYAVLALGLVGGFIANGIEPLAAALTLLLLAALARRRTYPYVLTAALLGATLLQLVIYRGPIFEHYLVPIAPVLYMAVAAALAQLTFRFFLPATIALLTLNLARTPLLDPPTNHLARTTAVAEAIAAHQPSATPFAIWLQSPNDTDNAYRYRLEGLGRPPTRPEDPPSAHLYLICQDQPCDQSSLGDDWPAAAMTWQSAVERVTVQELAREVSS